MRKQKLKLAEVSDLQSIFKHKLFDKRKYTKSRKYASIIKKIRILFDDQQKA